MTEETERLCPSCGNPNPPDAQFCRECGAILVQGRGGAKRSEAETAKVSLDAGKPPSPRRRRRGGGLAAIAVVILLIAASLMIFYRRRAATLPVPGEPQAEATPETPDEQRAAATGTKPTLPAPTPEVAPTREEARARPTVNGPSELPAVTPAIPLASGEATPPSGEAPAKPAHRAAAEHAAQPSRRHHTGWYRVRYRTPLFESPSETAPVVTHLAPGTRIHVTRVLPGFLAVESTTGKPPGYVSSDDVLPDSVAGTYP